MRIYTLKKTQRLSISIEEAWEFFSNPRNLKIITPPDLCFINVSPVEREIFRGMIIEYSVRPLLNIPLKWISEITEVQKPFCFVDEQRKGPYRLWRHKHCFRAIDGGVEIEDAVDYALPFGLLGKLAHSLIVKKQLEHIFSFREKTLREKFRAF